jgi:hypothetical protein
MRSSLDPRRQCKSTNLLLLSYGPEFTAMLLHGPAAETGPAWNSGLAQQHAWKTQYLVMNRSLSQQRGAIMRFYVSYGRTYRSIYM